MDKRIMKVITLILSCLLLIGAAVGITVAAEEPAPTVEIAKKNIAYEGAIQIVYLVEANNLQDGQTVAISFNDGEYVKKPAGEITLGGKTYKAVYSNGIIAKEYRKALVATPVVLDAEGNTVATGAEVNFTAYDYAMTRFDAESISETQFNLYKALLDYSAAVQVVLGFNDETVATVGGWADEYYKLVLNGETTYERGAEFDGTLVMDRFNSAGEMFDGWTDAEDKTVVGWTSMAVKPGTTVLNAKYRTPDASLLTFDGVTDLSTLTTVKKSGSSDSYATVGNDVLSFGKTSGNTSSGYLQFAPATPGVYARKYVFEADFNLESWNMTKTGWNLKFDMWTNGNSNDKEIFNVTLHGANGGSQYAISNFTGDMNTWHRLKYVVSIADDGTFSANMYVDGLSVGASIQKAVTASGDYKMSYAGIALRDGGSSEQDCTQMNILFDNVECYTVGDPVSYDITLDANNGDETTTQNVTMGAEYTLPTPENGGKVFLGWYAGSKLVEQTGTWTYCGASKVDGNTVYGKAPTLTANWAESVNVTLDPTYGALPDGVSANMVCTESFDYTLPSPTLEGFSFNGWYYGDTKVENSGTWTLVDAESITLTAKWLYISKGAEETLTTSGSKYFYVPGYNTAVTVDTGIKYVFSAKYTYNGMSGFNGSGTAEDPFTAYSKKQPQYIKLYGTNTSGAEDKGWADVSYAGGDLVNAQGVVVCENGVLKEGYTNLTEAQVFYSTLTWCEITYEIAKTYDLTITFTKVANGFTIDLRAVAPDGSVQTKSYTQTGIVNLEYFKWEARSAENACGSADNTFKTSDTFANARFDTHTFAEEAQVTLDANGGTLPEGAASLKVITGATYTLPTPTLEGLDFAGWYYGDTKVENTGKWTFAEKEVTLTAKWLMVVTEATNNYDDGTYSYVNPKEYTASVVDGQLKAELKGKTYQGFIFETPEVVTGMPEGSKYIYETDFTYNGINVTYATDSTGMGWVGFLTTKSIDNGGMIEAHMMDYGTDGDGDGVIDFVSVFGQKYYVGEKVTIRLEYIVGESVTRLYHDGEYLGTTSLTGITNGGTDYTATNPVNTLQGFSWHFRSAARHGRASFLFDNTTIRVETFSTPVDITLDANGGTLPEGAESTITAMSGSLVKLPIPTVDGCLFGGWYNGDTKVDNNYMVAPNSALTARWLKATDKTYADKVDVTNTAWSTVASFATGNADGTVDVVGTKYIFTMKYTYKGFTAFTLDTETGAVTANASGNYGFPRLYNKSGGANDAIVLDGEVKPAGNYVNAAGEIVVADGKLVENSGITAANQIFYSQLTWWGFTFEIGEQYTFVLEVTNNGVGVVPTVVAKATDSNGNVQTNPLTPAGAACKAANTIYNLAFYTRNNGTFSLTQSFVDAGLQIQVPVSRQQVTLDVNGGTLPEGAEPGFLAWPDTVVELPVPTKEGYIFGGWYDGDTKVVSPYTVVSDATLKARWNVSTTYDLGESNKASVDFKIPAADYDPTVVDSGETQYIFRTKYSYGGLTAFSITNGKVALTSTSGYANAWGYIGFFNNNSNGSRINITTISVPSTAKLVDKDGNVVVEEDGTTLKAEYLDENGNPTIAATEIFYSQLAWGGCVFEMGETYDIVITATTAYPVLQSNGTYLYTNAHKAVTTVVATNVDDAEDVQNGSFTGTPSTDTRFYYNCQGVSFYWRGATSIKVGTYTAKASFTETTFETIKDADNTKKAYVATFDYKNNATASKTTKKYYSVSPDAVVGVLNADPTYTGYTFVGWKVSGDTTNTVVEFTEDTVWTYDSNVTFEAMWEAVTTEATETE